MHLSLTWWLDKCTFIFCKKSIVGKQDPLTNCSLSNMLLEIIPGFETCGKTSENIQNIKIGIQQEYSQRESIIL